MNYVERWCIDMFRIAAITKDYPLEDEVLFILSVKKQMYESRKD